MNIEEACSAAQRIAREVLTPNSARVDKEAVWPEESLRALQKAGLGGLVVPREAGGLGLGLLGLARVSAILGKACSSGSICFGMHCVGAAVIAAKATRAQTERYLRPIAQGKHLTTLALSEPGTGSHFYLPQSRISETSSGFRIEGTKSFVTNGGHADSYVVSVGASGAQGTGRFACALVPGNSRNLTWTDPWTGLGMRGNSAQTLKLQGVEIGADERLGAGDDEIWYVFNVIAPYFLIAMSGTYLGVAEASLEIALEHVRTRSHAHSGRRLADEPLIQHRLGELWAWVERTRQLILHAARQGDAGRPEALVALCSAKAEVADCAVGVANEAMTLVGGVGYRSDSALHRHLRDARAAHVMAPPTDILRTWAGRALVGVPLLGD